MDEKDKVDQAIAAAEQTMKVVRLNVTMHVSDRPAQLIVPADLTEAEALALCSYLATLPERLAAQRPESRIIVPAGPVMQ